MRTLEEIDAEIEAAKQKLRVQNQRERDLQEEIGLSRHNKTLIQQQIGVLRTERIRAEQEEFRERHGLGDTVKSYSEKHGV